MKLYCILLIIIIDPLFIHPSYIYRTAVFIISGIIIQIVVVEPSSYKVNKIIKIIIGAGLHL